MHLPSRIVLGVLAYAFCMLGGALLGNLVAGGMRGTRQTVCIVVGAAVGALIAWCGRVFHYRGRS